MKPACLLVALVACGGDDASVAADGSVDVAVVPGDFSCQGRAYPATASDPVVVAGGVPNENSMGVGGATVDIHALPSDALLGTGTTSGAPGREGTYSISIATGGVAPRIYRAITASGELPAFVYDGLAVFDRYSVLSVVQSAAAIDGYARTAGVTIDPARGTLALIIDDCRVPPTDVAVAGATIDAPPGSTVVYVDAHGAPDPALTATSSLGQVLVLNAAPGLAEIAVHAGPVTYRAWPIEVRAGAFTTSFRYP